MYSSVYVDKSSSNPSTWTYGSNTLLTGYQFWSQITGTTIASTATGKQTGGFLASRSLGFAIRPDATNAWSTTSGAATAVVVNLPYSTSDIQLLTSYIETSSFLVTDIKEVIASTVDASVVTTATNTYAYGTNTITISTVRQIPTSSEYLIFTVGGGSSDDVALPYVASNKATFYETWVTATTSSAVDIYNTMISVFVKDASTDVTSLPLCTDLVMGIPIYSLFTAIDMDITFGTTYALEIALTTAGSSVGITNLGYADTDSIPFAGGVTGQTITYNEGLLTIMGLGTVDSGDTVETYIPWDNSWATSGDSYKITTRLYYTVSTNAEQYVLYSKSDSWTATAVTDNLSATWTTATLNLDTTATLAASVFELSAGSTSDGDYVGFSFPAGWSTSGASLSIASKFAGTNYKVSVSDYNHEGAFVMGVADANLAVSTSTATLSLSGVGTPDRVPGFAFTYSNAPINTWIASSTVGAVCTMSTTISGFSLTGSTITAYSFTPTAVNARGYDSGNTMLTVSFTTINGVPVGGSVVVTIDSSWGINEAQCSCSGVSNQDANTAVSCGISGQVVTVTGFAAISSGSSLTISIWYVLPPTSDNAYVSSIKTFGHSSLYIDEVISITDTVTVNTAVAEGTSEALVASVFPNAAGLTDVDVYLSFALTLFVPAGGTLSLNAGFASWNFASGEINDYCWSNIQYSDCSMSGSKVVITLANDLPAHTNVMVYLDGAVDLPSTAQTTTAGWQVTSDWNGQELTTDASTSWLFTVLAPTSS
jgi:hypothetical protein